MKKNKGLLILCLLVIASIIGLIVFHTNFVLINGEMINRSSTEVVVAAGELPDVKRLQRIDAMEIFDLRTLELSEEEYETLSKELPDCKILWNVPFQGGYADNQTTELVVSTLTMEDIELLKYFPDLQTVDGLECKDYDALLELRNSRSDLNLFYAVDMGDYELRENATECMVTNDNVRTILEMLPYLPQLVTVNADGCTDYETLAAIREAKPELTVDYSVIIGEDPHPWDAAALTLDVATAADALEKLRHFPNLTEVVFSGLAADNELMYELMCRYPDIRIHWEFELYGVATSSTATELYLNKIPMESVETVEAALKYFYDLQWVEMCQCGIPSEEMDALWKRHPETRFVWAIPMANGFVRTDVDAFIPYKYGYDINLPFFDKQAKELKYLVDLECLDLGHMRMEDISFLQYMPKLRYLILADTVCKDFSYLANLTELVYLELFRSEIRDVNLLMNLTKLEDLNIGWTHTDNPELLSEMKWLKRLWTTMNGMSYEELKQLQADLPDTYVYINSKHPTEGGWRKSYLYYEMRDMLDMFYMN